ncbi:MOSC N-terminal beta barrel domain-containing protein [Haloarculaceae archaeon H-GB2-1]|nr:MOSC N-terminal beta barrel domain-containing protein [Haloarculaceae archaeon H-GB1-1]MEA5389061.1 MOSC N-terminal beta barrel domain-containing protein [Haloarculaceae archaeon H-GB11]MEA5407122.1 MOSC N-terminal beta barrel domain-containing protein [Haloarculaceae archaeon H-GB2-1]
MAALAGIFVYPIKSLDATTRERASIVTNGALDGDREYAMVDDDGEYVNGKRTRTVHRIRADYDDDRDHVTLRVHGEQTRGRRFHLDDDRDAIEAWLDDRFDPSVELRREPEGGYPDDETLSGPTVVSTATLETVASWFPEMTVTGARRRFRANLEIGGVEPFWEERLYADHGRCVAFRIGDVTFRGVNPCQRCVVPSRDPDTGEETADFRETFLQRREATLPEWADSDRFDHYYRLMVNTQVPRTEWGETLTVGDDVTILEERALEQE